jgi:predicted dithiol-disulfide oxidoreductase (DUF899 family)
MAHFPGESPAYRTARNELLEAEIELRRHIETVADLRRRLPLGGQVPTDYVFEEGGSELADTSTVREVRLSELFGDKQTLVLYSFMFGPNMKLPCPMCTSFLDGLEGQAQHIEESVALAVTAKSTIGRVRAFARERGWNRLRMLSDAGSTYHRDYLGESEDGDQMPMMNVFVRKDARVHHFWGSELLYAETPEGQDPRHIDMFWPLWNVLDLTPAGRGTTWYPRLQYDRR